MRAPFRWSAWLVALSSVPAWAQPLTTEFDPAPPATAVDGTTITQELEFADDANNRITVPVYVAGAGPYNFLVDTGADRTAVSEAMASELRLTPGRRATLHTVTGTSFVATATVPHLQISADRVRSLDVAVLDKANMGADGILGVDSLRSQRVMFDFKKKLISIVPSAVRVYRDEPGTIVVQGKLKRGHLIVSRAAVEKQPTVIVLDTGSELSIGNLALRRKLEARRLLGEPEPVRMVSVTGQKLVGECFYIRELKIAGVTMRNLAIVFADSPIFRTLNLQKKPTVLLGMNAMRAFDKVSIDFARKKLRVLMPEHGMVPAAAMASRRLPINP